MNIDKEIAEGRISQAMVDEIRSLAKSSGIPEEKLLDRYMSEVSKSSVPLKEDDDYFNVEEEEGSMWDEYDRGEAGIYDSDDHPIVPCNLADESIRGTLSTASNIISSSDISSIDDPLKIRLKRAALSLSVLGIAEVSSLRLENLALASLQIERQLFSPDAIEEAEGDVRKLLALSSAISRSITEATSYVHQALDKVNVSELEETLALVVTSNEEMESQKSSSVDEIAETLITRKLLNTYILNSE